MTQTSHHHCATLQMWDKVIHADTAKEYRKDHNRLEKCKHKRPSTRTVRHWSSPLLSVNLRVFASICIVSLASKRISSTPFLCLSKEICVERKKSVETKWTKTTCKYSSHLLLSKTENGGKHENSVAISVVGHSASMAFVLSCNLACRVLMERLRKPSVKNATDVYRCNSKPTSLWSTRNSCGWISIGAQFSSQTFPGKELLVGWTLVPSKTKHHCFALCTVVFFDANIILGRKKVILTHLRWCEGISIFAIRKAQEGYRKPKIINHQLQLL